MPVKLPDNPQYIRVGTDYFKLIQKPDRFAIMRNELKKWTKEAIRLDHGQQILYQIPSYDDFVILPNNNGIDPVVGQCYNMYRRFPHKSKEGDWPWTFIMLKHLFGTQFKSGMIYLKVLYEFPKQALPILVLVSEERQTGKSTFLDWLNMLFGDNVAMIEPDVIGSQFNGEYATSNIIAIDETILEKQIAVEKIKSLATKKFISVNIKNVQQFKLPFFGKIILASNNEDKFMRIENKEIRFWIRKLGTPKIENHQILNDMVSEIPAFLYYLESMPKPDFSKSRMVLTEKQIRNKWLDAVKAESKSSLYKELFELFTDYFNNHLGDELLLTPRDIKNEWFHHNHQITINYIRRVIKTEFNLEASEKTKRYKVFGNPMESVGRPFQFKRQIFTGGFEDEKEPF